MAYQKNGKRNYTLREKVKYHTKLANTGHNSDGGKLTMTQRVRHANLAEKRRQDLDNYMKTYNSIKKSEKKTANKKSKNAKVYRVKRK